MYQCRRYWGAEGVISPPSRVQGVQLQPQNLAEIVEKSFLMKDLWPKFSLEFEDFNFKTSEGCEQN